MPGKCIGCNACTKLCEARAVIGPADLNKCCCCRRCTGSCYAGAIICSCRTLTPDELWTLLAIEKPYFENSNGGITFSGGECLLQPEFLTEIVKICRENGVHTAVDTAGHVPYQYLKQADPDLFLYDLKASSPEMHMALTGVDGLLIWENLTLLLRDGYNVTVRVPCVPGANWDELPLIASRLAELGVKNIELLPYHGLGEGKSALYGYDLHEYNTPSEEEMRQIKENYFCFQ